MCCPRHSFGYVYADKLNLTAVNDNVAAVNSVGLAYTPANRLGTATGPWGTASYSYDGTGNRLTETVTSGATTSRVLSYPASSNLLSGITENGASLRSYGYDAAGNITTDTRPGEVYAFTYNVRNRPVSVTRNSAAWATYAYNALEQMVSRSTSAPGGPTGTVQYVYDLSGHLIAEADGATGATLREYIWLAANDNGGTSELPLATVTNVNTTPVLYMVHADHLGRPIRMTDASKATVWQAVYKPFGEVQATSGTIANDLRFPGQFFLIETGLAYNWHRHYDPLTGRYTQPDPLRFIDGPSVYAYVGGSPYTYADQSGRFWNIALGAVAGGAANAAYQYWTKGCVNWWQVGAAAIAGATGVGLASYFAGISGVTVADQLLLNFEAGAAIGGGAALATGGDPISGMIGGGAGGATGYAVGEALGEGLGIAVGAGTGEGAGGFSSGANNWLRPYLPDALTSPCGCH